MPDWVKLSFVIFDIRVLWRSGLSARVPRCQKLQNDGLTQSGTGCIVAVLWQQWASKGWTSEKYWILCTVGFVQANSADASH